MSTNTLLSTYNLAPFRLAALNPPAKLNADLYIETNNTNDPFRLYTRAAHPPSKKDIDHLAQQGISELYVSLVEADQLREQYRELLKSGVSIPADVKLEMIREEAKSDLTAAWKGKS